jgi:uncharacterized membrane-anchored protein
LDKFVILSSSTADTLGIDTGGQVFNPNEPGQVVEYVKATLGADARVQFIALDATPNKDKLLAVQSEDVNVRLIPLDPKNLPEGEAIDLNYELKGAVAWLFSGNLSSTERSMWRDEVTKQLSEAGVSLSDKDTDILVNGTTPTMKARTADLGRKQTVLARVSRFA